MSTVMNCPPCCTGGGGSSVSSSLRKVNSFSNLWRNPKAMPKVLRKSENDNSNVCRLAPSICSSKYQKISMALVDEKPVHKGNVVSTSPSILAYDLILGELVRELRITPRVLVGHSFGGKVALSMVDQAAKPLARPVKVWVLDATPGKVRAGGDGEDHPAELIAFLNTLPNEVSSKREVVKALIQQGFSNDVAQWVVTSLQTTSSFGSRSSSFSWTFDLKGIAEMYQSYEETNLWKVVEDVPRGVHVNFLKAERSLHRWALEDLQRIHAAEELAAEEGGGVEMHVLEDAGHWVHTDNPDGLFRILSSSFQRVKA